MSAVWVATVDTHDEIVAVATEKHAAIQIAARRALKYLRDAGAVTVETNTVYKVAQYFGISAVEVPVGGAVFLRG